MGRYASLSKDCGRTMHRTGALSEFKFYLSLYVFDWLAFLVWISFLNKVSRRDLLNSYCGRILQCHACVVW